MIKEPLVTIQILNWNRVDETLRAISSSINQSYRNIEVVVVDNGSTDDSIDKIETTFPQVKLLKLDKNYGCPGGRNRGIPYCTGEYILFCDNDGVLHYEAVQNAISIALSDEKIAIVTGIVKEFEHDYEIDTHYKLTSPTISMVGDFLGGISLHHRKIYNEIAIYPDDYIYGGEETFLSLKVIEAGFRIIKNDTVVLWHKKSILARDIKKESLLSWGNKLSNAYQLYPTFYFFVFIIYFFTFYPIYAIRNGFLIDFINIIPFYLKRLMKYKRNPIRYSTYKFYRRNLL